MSRHFPYPTNSNRNDWERRECPCGVGFWRVPQDTDAICTECWLKRLKDLVI